MYWYSLLYERVNRKKIVFEVWIDLESFCAEWNKIGHTTAHMLSSDYHSFIVWSWSGSTLSLGFVVA